MYFCAGITGRFTSIHLDCEAEAGDSAFLDGWRMITSVHVKIFLGISQLQSLVSCFILCCVKLGVLVQNISEAITAFWQNNSMQQCEGFLWMQPRQPIR